jgi:hypothetical protein
LSVDKYFDRANTPLNLQPKFESAIHIYKTTSRALFNKMEFRLELDACLRWCSLLWEQNDAKVNISLIQIELFIYRLEISR